MHFPALTLFLLSVLAISYGISIATWASMTDLFFLSCRGLTSSLSEVEGQGLPSFERPGLDKSESPYTVRTPSFLIYLY